MKVKESYDCNLKTKSKDVYLARTEKKGGKVKGCDEGRKANDNDDTTNTT